MPVSFHFSKKRFGAELDSGGTDTAREHGLLTGRERAGQHPISAISGLSEALNGKQPAGNYLTSETDPTVPSWAKQQTKPAYTAAEVGALPDSAVIPTKTSQLTNDSGFLTSHQSLSAYRTAAAQDLIDAGKQPVMDVITYDVSSYEDVNDALSTGKPVMLAFDAYTAVPISSYDFDMQSQDIRIYIVTGEHVSVYSLTQSDVWDTQDVPLSVYLNPDAKTSAMTQAVGKDDDGKLWTTPGSSGAAWGSITGTLSSQTDLQTALNGKQAAISDLSTIRTGAGLGATAVQPEAGKGLFSGSYNDLTNKPAIPAAQVNSDWNAASGVAQILNKPTIPTTYLKTASVSGDTLTLTKQDNSTVQFQGGKVTVISGGISLPMASWIGSASPYTQTVSVTGATANSKIDLQPDSTVIAQMLTDGTSALYIENNNGTLTAYAIGTKPGANLTVQATRTEVTA